MTTMRWFRAGATPRGTPKLRRALRRHPVVLLVLALAALCQTGCQTGPCGSCSPCGTRIRDFSERVFRPVRNVFHGVGPCCGSGLGVEAAPGLPYGTPTVVSPSVPVVTPGGGSPVIQGPSDSGPSLEPIPSNSERIPSAIPSQSSGSDSSSTKSSAGKVNYEALKPNYKDTQVRAGAPPKTLDASPEPTLRSAQGTSAAANSLDNLPPLDIARIPIVTDLSSPPPAPAAPAGDSAADNLADLAAQPAAAEVNVAPGIQHFAGVDTKLSGGSLPDVTGLDWLAERGYKTILDLREESEISTSFISDVAKRGMRYVALPINVKTVDADHLDRFNAEVSLAQARPLYFCDTDGTRAGVMWYLRRITVDRVGEPVARRDAEDIGLSDAKFWLAANVFPPLVPGNRGSRTRPPSQSPPSPPPRP